MKKKLSAFLVAFLWSTGLLMAQSFAPFFKTADQSKDIQTLSDEIVQALGTKGFDVVGTYKPMQSTDLMVICFTRGDLQSASLSFKDRGALASVLKIGLQKTSGGVSVSLQNPMYMFYAYFREEIDSKTEELKKVDVDAKAVLYDLYGTLTPFGGALDADKLMNYHYKVMMPYFDDPVKLETYASFQEGLDYINAKIATSANVKKVYEQVYADKEVAVIGLALTNKEEGESHFLPIIGESHLAAMPYEIILQGKEVTMLPGKYRIALYWPELTMGTFMKIMSTPGDIENAFEEITEK